MHQQQTVMELANFVSILTFRNFRQRNVGVTPGTLCRSEVSSLFSPLQPELLRMLLRQQLPTKIASFSGGIIDQIVIISFCDDLRGLQEPYGSIT